MIEDELRTLLRSRAAAPPPNATRLASVHARITRTRRRAAGGALTLVLLALAGLVAVRLPGTDESLPLGVPKPPYFADDGTIRPIRGYVDDGGRLDFTGPTDFGTVNPGSYRYLLVVRCEQKGSLTARNTNSGEQAVVPCTVRVGDHFEGAVAVPADRTPRLLAETGDARNLTLTPGSGGPWSVGFLKARLPERLAPGVGGYLLDGRRTPAGGTVDFAPSEPQTDDPPASPALGFTLSVECVEGVRLTFRVPAGELGQVSCIAEDLVATGAEGTVLQVSGATMRRLGLAYGRTVRLTVVRTGTETDQWRVSAVG